MTLPIRLPVQPQWNRADDREHRKKKQACSRRKNPDRKRAISAATDSGEGFHAFQVGIHLILAWGDHPIWRLSVPTEARLNCSGWWKSGYEYEAGISPCPFVQLSGDQSLSSYFNSSRIRNKVALVSMNSGISSWEEYFCVLDKMPLIQRRVAMIPQVFMGCSPHLQSGLRGYSSVTRLWQFV